MTEEVHDINKIIIRYLDGSASLEEKCILLQWLKQSEYNREDFTSVRDLWLSCSTVEDNELEIDIALENLKRRIFLNEKKSRNFFGNKFVASIYRQSLSAAFFLLVISIGYMVGSHYNTTHKETIVEKQLITAKGSKGEFMLPDGTKVWLNSGTTLTYPEHFAKDKRSITLDGAAYFEVTKDASKPFIVETSGIQVEVLGTSFNIDHYPSSDYIKVALIEGKVKISEATMSEPIYLKPDELFKYRKTDRQTSVEDVKAELYTDWIKERLVFDNDRLSDILTSMSGRFQKDIICQTPLATSIRLSFTIRQESLKEVLEAISEIAPISYEIKEKEVIITSIQKK